LSFVLLKDSLQTLLHAAVLQLGIVVHSVHVGD
jgi:hypothetical protein